MEILKLCLLSLSIIAIAFAGLSIKVLFKKNGKFPITSVGQNKEMKKRNITCSKHGEYKCYNKLNKNKDCACG